MNDHASETYWSRFSRDWHLIGPPLRPCREDLATMEQFVSLHHQSLLRPLRVALLGVTPEIVSMAWPEQTRLLGFDCSCDMIRALWPAQSAMAAAPVCANWLSLPLGDGSCDLAVGDGCFVLLRFPGEYRLLAGELARVLVPGGGLVIRAFLLPAEAETVEALFEELWRGGIANFNAFKWRLLMALQQETPSGVRVGDAWRVWHQRVPRPDLLSRRLNWPLPVIEVIDRYRDSDTIYTYPHLDELRDALAPQFELERAQVPEYQGGERYQTLLFRRL